MPTDDAHIISHLLRLPSLYRRLKTLARNEPEKPFTGGFVRHLQDELIEYELAHISEGQVWSTIKGACILAAVGRVIDPEEDYCFPRNPDPEDPGKNQS